MGLSIIRNTRVKFQDFLKKIAARVDKRSFGNKEFVIIANNCWGAEIYKRLDREYNTPFVGLFLYGEDYVRLLENFDTYMSYPLSFINSSKWFNQTPTYPIGLLNDIEIHFLHYNSNDEAQLKWTRRLTRMNLVRDKNNYFFKICDNALTDETLIYRFHQLPFKNKISFSIKNLEIREHIYLVDYEHLGFVPNGVALYIITYRYVDLLNWIKTGEFSNNLYSRAKAMLRIT